MARKRKSSRLNVFLNGRHVGRLDHEASGAIAFQYDPAWLGWRHALAVSLSMPLREDRYIGAPVTAVFDNLLPDNAEIRKIVAGRVGAAGTDAFSLLSVLGRDCVGALQFLTDDEESGPVGQIAGHPLKRSEIAKILASLGRNPLGLQPDDDFRISIAGAQEKTALLRYDGQWLKPEGTTATTHILKPAIGELPNGINLSHSVENEYLCLKLTAAFGLPSAEVAIARFGDAPVLVVERFDRRFTADNRLLRIPQEDCCQALSIPWTKKYESEGGPGVVQILKLLSGSEDPDRDRRAFLKATIVFWLLAATDGHAKNFSLFLAPGGGFSLTPLYDVISAQPSLDAGQIRRNRLKLAMAVGDTRHYLIETISSRHFFQSAAAAGVGKTLVNHVFDELLATIPDATNRVLNALPRTFPHALADSIIAGLHRRLRQLAQSRP